MRTLAFSRLSAAVLMLLGLLLAAPASAAPEPKRIQVRGEIIDTWCYYSGVMGPEDAVVGSAHHTCALWCAAGGIPVGLLAEDGTVYMVLKLESDDHVAGGETILDLQSDVIQADGLLYERDGIKYLVVQKVLANDGVVNQNHEDYGVVPEFAFPKPKK